MSQFNYRSFFYDLWLGNSWVGVSTPFLYKEMLNKLPDNATLLEIGIGNGVCIEKNAVLIKEKNIKIDGIDIDEDYVREAKKRVKLNGLEENVNVMIQDLLQYKTEK